MSSIIPESDALRRAVRWISDNLKMNPAGDLRELIDSASFKFNLSPQEGMFLINFYMSEERGTGV